MGEHKEWRQTRLVAEKCGVPAFLVKYAGDQFTNSFDSPIGLAEYDDSLWVIAEQSGWGTWRDLYHYLDKMHRKRPCLAP